MIKTLKLRLFIPIVLISILCTYIATLIIQQKISEQIDEIAKYELRSHVEKLYFYIESDFKTLFFRYGDNEKKFLELENSVKKEAIESLKLLLDDMPEYFLYVKTDSGVLSFNIDLPFEEIEDGLIKGYKTVEIKNRGNYIYEKARFAPWGWDLYLFTKYSRYGAIIEQNSIFILSTVISILILILFVIYVVIERNVNIPIASITDLLSSIKQGSHKTLRIDTNSEMERLIEDINVTSEMINRREESLKNQLKYTKAILEAQASVVVIAKDGKIEECNHRFFELFNEYGTLEDFKKEHDCVCEFFEDINKEEYLAPFDKNSSTNVYETIAKNRDKTYRVAIKRGEKLLYFTLNAANLTIDKNRYNIVVLTDVTEAENYRFELEKRVEEEIGARIKQEVVIHKLERERSVNELITNIAHQWRQPLNIVSISLSEIEDSIEHGGIDRGRINSFINSAMDQIRNISNIITSFTKFSSKNNDINRFAINEPIEEALELIDYLVKESGAEVDKKLQNDLFAVGSKKELTEISLRIISNAIDQFKREKTNNPKIFISSCFKEGFIHIFFEDNGGGIPEDILNVIFDPYTTTQFKTQGRGLSLYFVKKSIDEIFKGSIVARNGEKGAIFEIKLPGT